MKHLLRTGGAMLLASQLPAVAQDYSGNPKLPGVPYVVHDMTRPQPRMVETGGALNVKAPGDATVLFDGRNLDAWEGGFKVENGVMVAAGKDLVSKESFGPIQLHFEWRLPAGRKVNGQGGGNSGIFLMGLYEVQVLQSNGNKTYPDGQAGAMYGQRPPLVNATSPQGEWQSYDVIFTPPIYENGAVTTPAILTLLHNGVLVQNAQPYLGPTQHKKLAAYPAKHPEKGPLRIQFHGDPMEYRNIWVRPIGEIDRPE